MSKNLDCDELERFDHVKLLAKALRCLLSGNNLKVA